jgi:hypothetical protein
MILEVYLYFIYVLYLIIDMDLINEKCIYSAWVHSYEEDITSKKVYRPPSFEFPPSRGRESLDIKTNGEIVFNNIGPDDRPQKISGNFKIKDSNKLYIEFNNKTSPFIITILSCDKNILVIQRE